MKSAPAPREPGAVGLPSLVVAACVGGAGMWLVLNHGAGPQAAPVASTPAAAPAAAPSPATSPWPAPAAASTATNAMPRSATAPARATNAASAPAPEIPSARVPPGENPADYALDDATLVRRARTQFGLDCPGIAERATRRSGHFDVVCSNGLVLRVYLMGDGPPRIAPGH